MIKKIFTLSLFIFLFIYASNISKAQSLYFCEEYTDHEVNVSDVFLIGSGGGYFCCMLDLRGSGETLGTYSVVLKISKITSDGDNEQIDSKGWDVKPEWDYIYFNQFYTFYSPGTYKVTATKSNGTFIASGKVTVKYK